MKSIHGIILALALAWPAQAATVTATLDPQQIALGDSAQLTVTVSGGSSQPDTPAVNGLDIRAVGQSTQVEFVNGAITANASVTYQVTPQREGTFTIPAIHAGGASSQPVTLRVGKGLPNAAVPAQNNLPPPSTGPVVMPNGATPATSTAPPIAADRFGSIQISLPKKEFYIGELVPVDIKVFIPEDTQASDIGLPQFTSDGFTLNALGTKPDRSEEVANGRAYAVFTWHSALTGVKTGEYPATLKMPLTVIVQQQLPQGGDDSDMFNNFFKNAMAAMGQRKQIEIHSADQTFKVLPLPQENRPADFSGAVGQFDIESSASPTTINAGDPITLRLKITGSGNFDRVSTNMLPADTHWKSYSPKSHFDPADSVGYAGTKTFEQPIIPTDSSVTAVPPVSFSFFNPETRQYVTRTTAPVAVTVSGSAPAPAPAPIAAAAPAPSNQPAPPSSDLRPNKLETGSFVSTLRPVYLSPAFLGGQAVPLLALLGGLAFIRRQKLVTHPERLRATAVQQAIRAQIDAMDEAMRNHQTAAFFIHARSAFQQQLGPQWKMAPDAVTLADVEARLTTGLEAIRPVFEMADQAKYSDLHFGDADLQQWREAVVAQLAEKHQ